MDAILQCNSLTKMFPSCMALNHVSLSIHKGNIVGLLGPNGSGKSTLIKIATGLMTPTTGQVLIRGMEPGVETKKLSLICRNEII